MGPWGYAWSRPLSVRAGMPGDRLAWHARPHGDLACAGRGGRQLCAGAGPDFADTAAGADEEGRGGESHESQEQGVLDEILALFVVPKVTQERHIVVRS